MAGCGRYGNVVIYSANMGQDQSAEIEHVRELTLPEEMRYYGILEAHHTELVRSGVAKKIAQLQVSRHAQIIERYGRPYGSRPTPIDAQAELCVVKRTVEHTEPDPVEVILWSSRRTSRMGTHETIGHREVVGGNKDLLPQEPFTEEDIALVEGMIEELDEARTSGKLPHLDADLRDLRVVCPSYITYAIEHDRTSWLDGLNLSLGEQQVELT